MSSAAAFILLWPSVQNIGDQPSRNKATAPVARDDSEAGKSDSMNRRGMVKEFPKAHAVWTTARVPAGADTGSGYNAGATDGAPTELATDAAIASCAAVGFLGAG